MSKDKVREAICSNVARQLREERQRRCLSMNTLARKAGLSQAMISFVERDLRNPTLDLLLRITDVLELSLGEVIAKAEAQASQKAP